MNLRLLLPSLLLSTLLSAQAGDNLSPCEDANGQFGFCDTSGNLVIEHQYDNAFGFVDNHAPVLVKDKWGIIDTEGNWMVKPTYDEVLNCDNVPEMVLVREGKKWAFINAYGIQMSHEFEVNVAWHEFEITHSTAHFNRDAWFAVIRNGKWGIIDINDETQVPFVYEWIGVLKDENEQNHSLILKKEGFYAWQRIDGSQGTAFEYDEYLGYENNLIFFRKNGETVIFNANNGQVFQQTMQEHYALVNAEHKMGLVNRSGEIVLPFKYEAVSLSVIPDFIVYGEVGDLTISDMEGNVLFEKIKKVKKIGHFENTYAVQKQNGKCALVRAESKLLDLTGFRYDEIEETLEEVIVHQGNQQGISDASGNITW